MQQALAAPAPRVAAATAVGVRAAASCRVTPAEEVAAATVQPLVLEDEIVVEAVTPSASVLHAVAAVTAVAPATAEEITASSIEPATATAMPFVAPAPCAQRPLMDHDDDNSSAQQQQQQQQPTHKNKNTKSNTIRVEDLRPTDFEGTAAVPHEIVKTAAPWYRTILPAFLRHIAPRPYVVPFKDVVRYVVIKNEYLFIYVERTDPAPLYTFPLTAANGMKVVYEDPTAPHPQATTIVQNPGSTTHKKNTQYKTILILQENEHHQEEDHHHHNNHHHQKLLYQFTFDTMDDRSKAKLFYDTVTAKTATTTAAPGATAVVGISDLGTKKNEKAATK